MPQTAASLEPDVRLPRAVRERAERSRAPRPPQALPSEQPDPASTPANDPLADPQPAAALVVDPQDPTSKTEPPVPPAPPADPRHADPAYWEQRFRVTQGILERERRERAADQERADQVASELREQLRTTQHSTPRKIDIAGFFSPEQVEQFGEEQCRTVVEVALRAADEQVQRAIQSELQPIREERQRDVQDRQRQRQAAFREALAELVPNFETVDTQQGWLDWLSEEDEATGEVRQVLLTKAVASGRADRAAKLFNAYLTTLPKPSAPPIAPSGRGGPPVTPVPPPAAAKGYPSKMEIKEHFKLTALGKKTDQDIAEFEARLRLPRPDA